MGDSVQLTYMNWEKYKSATLERAGHNWDTLTGADLIIGGLNFSLDFMWVTLHISSLIKRLNLYGFNREAAKDYNGLTSKDVERHWDSLGVLCSKTMMWPDPRDLLMTGSKLYLHTIIARAAQALGHSLPSIVVCPNPTVNLVQNILDGKVDGVLKREYSSDTKHVFTRHTEDAVKKFQSAIERERECWRWDGRAVCENPKWFIQPYIPSLVYLGELRAFIVNGIIINILSTTPVNGLLDTCQAGLLRPLCKIQYAHSLILVLSN